MILKLVDIKDPILRKKAKPVKKIDKKIKKLIADMRETLSSQSDPEGVGLAAPQVGKSLKIFLVDHEGIELTVINPEIVSISKEKGKKKTKNGDVLEGCLSLPHFYGPLSRSQKITISFRNEDWKRVERTFTGFLAQIIQHEIDHLEGVLFVDRIIEQDAKLFKFHGEEWEEVDLL